MTGHPEGAAGQLLLMIVECPNLGILKQSGAFTFTRIHAIQTQISCRVIPMRSVSVKWECADTVSTGQRVLLGRVQILWPNVANRFGTAWIDSQRPQLLDSASQIGFANLANEQVAFALKLGKIQNHEACMLKPELSVHNALSATKMTSGTDDPCRARVPTYH